MLKEIGTIAGKPAYSYPAQPPVSVQQLRQQIRRFPTYLTLRQFGQLSALMLAGGRSTEFVGGLPLQAHAIPYLALISIESSNDYRGVRIDETGLRQLTSMYLSLSMPDPETLSTRRGALEFLLATSQTLGHQGEMWNQTARTLSLFKDIWRRVPQANGIDPQSDLSKTVGIDLDRIVFFGQSFSGGAGQGHTRPFPQSVVTIFDRDAQREFLRWASADYGTIRQWPRNPVGTDPNPILELYRFNPLVLYPMIRPDVDPDPNPKHGPLYLIPCPRLLYERVGRGLYHLLADRHRGAGSENPFRTAFGFVFQEYVGTLLRNAVGTENVLAERRYPSADGDIDTVDWFVLQDDCVVLVEVKQSSLTLRTKTTGDLDVAIGDLRRTLGKAATQLYRTERDLRAGRVKDLGRLGDAREFERVVITYDDLHWGNSFLRDIIAEDFEETPFTHFASIAEFEYLLGACRQATLPALLRRKRLGAEGAAAMDLQDWLGREFPDVEPCTNAFLDRRYEQAMEEWGVPSLLRRRPPMRRPIARP